MKKKQKKQKQLKNKENVYEKNIFHDGTVGLIDMILPDVFNEEKDYIYLGSEKYCRIYSILVYPRTMYVGILNDFFSLGNVDISTHIQTIPDNIVISQLNTKISKIQSNLILQQKRGIIIDYGAKQAVADLDGLRESIQTNTDRMFFSQIFITIWGTSIEQLDEKSQMFEDICARKAFKPRLMAYEQKDSYISALPLLNPKMSKSLRNMTSGAIACLIPTGNTELSHKSGIFFGQNVLTGSPIFLDNFIGPPEMTNQHIFVCGIAGSGKSVTLKEIVLHGVAAGEWAIILDPEEEYKKVVEHLGGQYIVLRPGEKSGINPFELEPEDDGNGKQTLDIYGKISDIRGMLSVFAENRGTLLTVQEITQIEEAVKKMYSKRGITKEPETLYEEVNNEVNGKYYTGKIKKQMPTLSELREELMQSKWTQDLAEMMKIITGDGSMAMFDGETKIDLNNRVIAIDLKHLTDEFTKFYATVNILSWIWAKFSNYKVKDIHKRVIVDEGWLFARYTQSAAFLEEIARRGRKYKISLVIASQQINEFLQSQSGKAVINQCATKIILKQNPSSAGEVADYFKLSDRCSEFISGFQSGRALLKTDTNLVVMQVSPFDFEWDYIKT